MKKRIVLLLSVASMLLTVNAFAWTPVQLSFWEGVKNLPNSENVNGVKIGLPFSFNYWGMDQAVNGLEMGVFTDTNKSTGLQMSFVNINTIDCIGMQLAGVSVSQRFKGFQMGAYNEVTQSTAAQLGFTNTSKRESSAYQVGVINNATDDTDGVQVGVFNLSYGFKGVQVGIINTNYRRSSNSLQIGLINYMEDGFLPIFPFFNYRAK